VNAVFPKHFLYVDFAVVFGLVAFRAAANTSASQSPLELTAANLARVIDPLMTEWIDQRKGPGAVVIVPTGDVGVRQGYGFARCHDQQWKQWS
jgi:CubicO group peptidase (beta-lactamase class C family)